MVIAVGMKSYICRAILLTAALLACAACRMSSADYVAKADRLAQDGKFAEALLLYQKAIQKDPKSGVAYYRAGLVLLKQQSYPAALNSFVNAIRLQPDNQDAKVQLSELYLAAYVTGAQHPPKLRGQIRDLADSLLASDVNSFQGLRLKGYLALVDRHYKDA